MNRLFGLCVRWSETLGEFLHRKVRLPEAVAFPMAFLVVFGSIACAFGWFVIETARDMRS